MAFRLPKRCLAWSPRLSPEVRRDIRQTLDLAWPAMAAHLLHQLMPTIDTIMVGRLGTRELAGMAMALPLVMFTTVFAVGVLSVVGAQVSHAHAQGRVFEIHARLLQSLWVGWGLSLLIVLTLALGPLILKMLGQDPTLIPLAADFLNGFMWGVPFFVTFVVFRQVVEGQGRTRPSLLLTILGVGANAFLDYALIFGTFGFPQLGVWGAGLATALVNILMCVGMFVVLRSMLRRLEVRSRSSGSSRISFSGWARRLWEVRSKAWAQLLSGLPFGGMVVLEVSAFAGATLLIGTFGVTPLAGHQIALNIASLAFMLPLGLAIAVGIRVAAYAGASDYEGVRRMGDVAFYGTLVMMCVPALLFILFAPQLAALYTTDRAVLATAVGLIHMAALFQWADGTQVVCAGLLRGLQDARVPLLNTLISFLILGFALAYLCVKVLGMEATGVWWALTASLASAATLHRLRFKHLAKRLLTLGQ